MLADVDDHLDDPISVFWCRFQRALRILNMTIGSGLCVPLALLCLLAASSPCGGGAAAGSGAAAADGGCPAAPAGFGSAAEHCIGKASTGRTCGRPVKTANCDLSAKGLAGCVAEVRLTDARLVRRWRPPPVIMSIIGATPGD